MFLRRAFVRFLFFLARVELAPLDRREATIHRVTSIDVIPLDIGTGDKWNWLLTSESNSLALVLARSKHPSLQTRTP